MGILQFLCFVFLFPIIHAAQHCSTSICGNSSIPVRFPFLLQDKQPDNCGFPGFNLSCNTQNVMVLKLPHAGDFLVREIDYLTQQILLYDPGACLARRFLSFNLSGSPFLAPLHQNYTFLSCPTQLTKSRFVTIGCLSNSTTSILATSSMDLASSLSTSCQVFMTVLVPVSWPVQDNERFSSDLNDDLQLTWDVSDCRNCEAQGGTCGFKNNTDGEIDCFDGPNKAGRSSMGLQVFMIICLCIAAPAISCAVGIAVFALCIERNSFFRANSRQQRPIPAAVTLETPNLATGLNDSTIESYQEIVLGESRRLPGPNDSTCPICLSEYCSKETLRCIPECKHCFHADCIDVWLRMNGTCPVCRNSPSRDNALSLDHDV